ALIESGASFNLRDNQGIFIVLKKAVQSEHESLIHTLLDLLKEELITREALLEQVLGIPELLMYMDETMKSDRAFIVELMVRHGGYVLEHASNSLRNNREFIIEVIVKAKHIGALLMHTSDRLRN